MNSLRYYDMIHKTWMPTMSNKRNFLSITDFSPGETSDLLQRACQMKADPTVKPLAGKSVALLFEKPSLRTRASFEIGIQQMGGICVYMGQQEVGLGIREPVSDVARVLSGYVDCIVARVFDHKNLEEQ